MSSRTTSYLITALLLALLGWLHAQLWLGRGSVQKVAQMREDLALAQQQGDVASIRALQALMKHAAVPKGTSAAKWQELRSRVDAKAAQ